MKGLAPPYRGDQFGMAPQLPAKWPPVQFPSQWYDAISALDALGHTEEEPSLACKWSSQAIVGSPSADSPAMSQCIRETCRIMSHLASSSILLTQIDFVAQLPHALSSLTEHVGSERIRPVLLLIAESILRVILEQLYGSRYRKYFVQSLLACQTTLDPARNLSTVDTSSPLYTLVEKSVTTMLENAQCTRVAFAKVATIMLEDRCLFETVLTSRLDAHDGHLSLLLASLAGCCLHEGYLRRTRRQTGVCPRAFSQVTETTEHLLADQDLYIVAKCLNVFIPFLIQIAKREKRRRLWDWDVYSNSCSQLLQGLLNLLEDPTLPREALTISGGIVALLIYHAYDNAVDGLHNMMLLIHDGSADQHTNDDVDDDETPQGRLRHWWHHQCKIKASLLRLSVLRGLLVHFTNCFQDTAEEDCRSTLSVATFAESITCVFDCVYRIAVNEDPVSRLYAIQTLAVFLTLTPGWMQSKWIQPEDADRNVQAVLRAVMINLDSSVKCLASQGFTTWTEVITQYRRTTPAAELHLALQRVYEAVMTLSGACRKYQYQAVEILLHDLGHQWILNKQPCLFEHLLISLTDRSTRGAALQLLKTLLQRFLREKKSTRQRDVPSWLRQSALGLLGRTESTVSDTLGAFPMTPPDDPAMLAFHVATYWVPVVGTLAPKSLVTLLNVLYENAVQPAEWSHGEVAILLAARKAGQARWTHLENAGHESGEAFEGIEIEGTDVNGENTVFRISKVRLFTGLVHADCRLRTQLLTALTYSKQTTVAPDQREWDIVNLVCSTSLKCGSPEERATLAAVVKTFLNRAVHQLKKCPETTEHTAVLDPWTTLHRTLMLGHIDAASPFDRVATALDILDGLYDVIDSLPKACKELLEKDLFSQHVWDTFSGFLVSNWDKQQAVSLRILRRFPQLPSASLIPMLNVACALLDGISQRAYTGGAAALLLLMEFYCRSEVSDRTWVRLLTALEERLQGTPLSNNGHNVTQCSERDEREEEKRSAASSTNSPSSDISLRCFDAMRCICRAVRFRLQDDGEKEALKRCCHGLLYLLGRCIRNLPPCKTFFDRVDDSSVRYASLRDALLNLLDDIADLQQNTTQHVLHCVVESVDSVLLTSDLRHSVEERLDPAVKILNVDCRGHPVIMSQQDEPEEDAALVGSWITVKEGAAALTSYLEWLRWDAMPQELTNSRYQFFDTLGHRTMTLLLGIKHPAAMDKLYNLILVLARHILESRNQRLILLPGYWLSRLCRLVTGRPLMVEQVPTAPLILPPPLRRSFSLGLAFTAVLTCDPGRYNNNLFFSGTMDLLIRTTATSTTDVGTKVHVTNILRHIVRCNPLEARCVVYLPELLAMAIRHLSHPDWSFRNSSHLLFAAVVDRLTAGVGGLAQKDVSLQHDKLMLLERSLHGEPPKPRGYFLATGAFEREQQARRARHLNDVTNENRGLTDLLIGCLTRRPSTSSAEHGIQEGVTVSTLLFLNKVLVDEERLLQTVMDCQWRSPSCHARILAARVIATYVVSRQESFEQIVSRFKPETTSGIPIPATNNAVHGVLAYFLELLGRPITRQQIARSMFGGSGGTGDLLTLMLAMCCNLRACAPLNATLCLQCCELLTLEILRNRVCSGKTLMQQRNPYNETAVTTFINRALCLASCFLPEAFRKSKTESDVKCCETGVDDEGVHELRLMPHVDCLAAGATALAVSAVRLVLLLNVSTCLSLTARFLLSLDSLAHPTVPAAVSECLRVTRKIQRHCPTWVDAHKSSHLEAACTFFVQRLEDDDQFVRGGPTDIMVYELRMRACKLLSQCISAAVVRPVAAVSGKRPPSLSVVPILCDALRTISQTLPASCSGIKASVHIGARLFQALKTHHHHFELLSFFEFDAAFQKATAPTSDVHVRYAAARTLCETPILYWPRDIRETPTWYQKSCFLVWTRTFALLMDESPEVQALASQAVSHALRTFVALTFDDLSTCVPFYQEPNWTIFCRTLQCNSSLTSFLALEWSIQTVVTVYQDSLSFPWIMDLLHGHSDLLSSSVTVATWRNDLPLAGRSDADAHFGLLAFDKEAANVFNEDTFFVRTVVQTFLWKQTLTTPVRAPPAHTDFLGAKQPPGVSSRKPTNSEVAALSRELRAVSALCRGGEATTTLTATTTAALSNPTTAILRTTRTLGDTQCSLGCPLYSSQLLPSVCILLQRVALYLVLYHDDAKTPAERRHHSGSKNLDDPSNEFWKSLHNALYDLQETVAERSYLPHIMSRMLCELVDDDVSFDRGTIFLFDSFYRHVNHVASQTTNV